MFLATRTSVGVTELAEELDVNKSTASRVLSTFVDAGIVEKNRGTQKYKLGPAILQLSERYYKNFNIITAAKPIMEQLAHDIRESVHLCINSNNSAVVINQILSHSRLVVSAKIGNREPLHASSVGKCLLTFIGEQEREQMLGEIVYKPYTSKTILTQEALLEEIERVREQGYAIDDGEISEDIKCVAVPIFDRRGNCRYSLGTSGANSRMTPEKIARIIPLMKKAAKLLTV